MLDLGQLEDRSRQPDDVDDEIDLEPARAAPWHRSRQARFALVAALLVGIAAGGFGWERWLGPDGDFIGMDGFGTSAPAADLYDHFGITPDAIVNAVRKRLSQQGST